MAFLVPAYIVFFLSVGQFCDHSFQPKNVKLDIIKVACESIRFSFALRRWGRFAKRMLSQAIIKVKTHVVFPGIK